MADGDFARNLMLLCSYHSSISEVCRRLEINRQQFNKYLHGPTRPSRHTLRRLCDFFGVEEAEMLLPHRRFADIVALRPRGAVARGQGRGFLHHVEALVEKGNGGLASYEGYYFRYFHSYGFTGRVVKSLLALYPRDGVYCTKNFGVLKLDVAQRRRSVRFKYLGLPLLINDRIFLMEYEARLGDMVSHTILYPAYRNRIDLLTGMQCTVAGTRGREPAAGRVALEYLGRRIDIRKALASCGIFERDHPAIDPAIRRRIANTIDPERHVLLADPA